MKNWSLFTVFALTLFAFSAKAQEKTTTEQMDPTTQTMAMDEEYTEIDKSTLPQPIKDAIMNDMDGMMVSKVWMAKDETFKIEVASQQDTAQKKTVYADAEGNWIDPKKTPKE